MTFFDRRLLDNTFRPKSVVRRLSTSVFIDPHRHLSTGDHTLRQPVKGSLNCALRLESTTLQQVDNSIGVWKSLPVQLGPAVRQQTTCVGRKEGSTTLTVEEAPTKWFFRRR